MADQSKAPAQPFAEWLDEHNGGLEAREASTLLRDVIAAVRETGKKGTLNVRVGLSLLDDDASTLVATVETTATLPRKAPKSAVYFATPDGGLSLENPAQPSFDSLLQAQHPTVLAVHSSTDDDQRDRRG